LNVEQEGEKRVVEKLARGLTSARSVKVKAGEDDCASTSLAGKQLVQTTDIMLRKTHFPKKMSYEQIGMKIAAANLSDLAAMGAEPLTLLIAFGVPPTLEQNQLKRIMSGVSKTCKEHSCSYVGGDTKKARELTLCGSATGVVNSEKELLKRTNAKPGDIVCLTGSVGNAACGLLILIENPRIATKLKNKLLPAFTHPKARTREARKLAQMKARIAAMDITDGVFYTCSEIARASGVGMDLESGKLPLSKELLEFAEKTGKPLMKLLSYGEDYELVVTVPEKKLKAAAKKTRLYPIGRVSKKKGVRLDGKTLSARGYDAFKSRA